MKPTLVPQGGTALDVLAERYRAALKKVKGGRELWIEGTLELAAVMRDAKRQPEIASPTNYNRWLHRNGLEEISPQKRSALNQFGEDLTYARALLESSTSTSWEHIWADRPNKAPRTLSQLRRGAPQPDSRRTGLGPRRTGYGQRKRAARIPDVMRDETPMPPPAPRKRLSDFGLTPEQVDPDFKGTALEFATKYGHVNLHTKGEIEQIKRQEALAAWLGAMADHERTGRAMLATLAAVDPATLQEWMSKPSKAEKLRTWHNSAQITCEAIGKLCG